MGYKMSNCGDDERKQKSLAIAMMMMAMIIIKDCSRCERVKTTRKLLKYLNQFTFFLFQPSLFFYAHESQLLIEKDFYMEQFYKIQN